MVQDLGVAKSPGHCTLPEALITLPMQQVWEQGRRIWP